VGLREVFLYESCPTEDGQIIPGVFLLVEILWIRVAASPNTGGRRLQITRSLVVITYYKQILCTNI